MSRPLNGACKELDKFQVLTARFIDTMHGHLAGNHPATTVDNARAVCELMSGLAQHLQRKNLIPSDLNLIYKYTLPKDEEPSRLDQLSVKIRKEARASSNFAKHADRDANQTHSFDGAHHMLVYNMVQDYEILHCAMLEQQLINHEDEKLYPVKAPFLMDFHKYRRLFHPFYSSVGEEISDSSLGILLKIELREDTRECHVPAGTAACIFSKNNSLLILSKEKMAERMRELEIWPVQAETNARMKQECISKPEQSCDI
jgi:hypothetical protein